MEMRKYIDIVNQLNEEVKWTQSLFDHLFLDDNGSTPSVLDPNAERFHIPIVPSMFKRLEQTRTLTAWHVMGPENLDRLVKAQGKTNTQISTFTTDAAESLLSGGIWSGHGLVALVRGDAEIGMTADMQSKADKQGRRIINIGTDADFEGLHRLDWDMTAPNYQKFMKDAQKMRAPILQNISQNVDDPSNVNPDAINGKLKAQSIKAFIDGLEPILKKHIKVFSKIFSAYVDKASKGMSKKNNPEMDYDEIIMGNFKIQKVIAYDTKENKEEDYNQIFAKGYDFPTEYVGDQDEAAYHVENERQKANTKDGLPGKDMKRPKATQMQQWGINKKDLANLGNSMMSGLDDLAATAQRANRLLGATKIPDKFKEEIMHSLLNKFKDPKNTPSASDPKKSVFDINVEYVERWMNHNKKHKDHELGDPNTGDLRKLGFDVPEEEEPEWLKNR